MPNRWEEIKSDIILLTECSRDEHILCYFFPSAQLAAEW